MTEVWQSVRSEWAQLRRQEADMCVAVPGEVIKVHGSTARVRIRKVVLDAECALMDSVSIGDKVLVHAGFIIEKISDAESDRMMEDLEDYSNITSQWEDDA